MYDKNLKEEVIEIPIYDCYVYKCSCFTKEGNVDCSMLIIRIFYQTLDILLLITFIREELSY